MTPVRRPTSSACAACSAARAASPCATSATSPSRNASQPCSSRVVAVREQPVGVAEPALRDRVVAAEHDRVVGQPRRGASRRARIAPAAIGPERPRPRVQARVALAQEPRRLRPALQRLGLLAVRERALEGRLGVVPGAAAERLEAGSEVGCARGVDRDGRSRRAARATDPG